LRRVGSSDTALGTTFTNTRTALAVSLFPDIEPFPSASLGRLQREPGGASRPPVTDLLGVAEANQENVLKPGDNLRGVTRTLNLVCNVTLEGIKKMSRYIAVLDGLEGAYGIVVPDLPGCTAAGETIADVVADAIAAVREWILDAREDGEAIPQARDMAALKANSRVAEALRDGAAFIVIPVLIDSGRPAKANLSLDSGLLEAIDAAAKASGLTRSSFIATAAREKIEHAVA
jgi:predicted RNase H-like HicB family nuclease